MILQSLIFYLFATVLLGASIMMLLSRNAVHSVLYLILAIFNAAGLFVLLGAELLALLFALVNVGAVAQLFLLLVKMLKIDYEAVRSGYQRYLPIGVLVGVVLFAELSFALSGLVVEGDNALLLAKAGGESAETAANGFASIATVLYTRYGLHIFTLALILVAAMVGAVLLLLPQRKDIKGRNGNRSIGQKVASGSGRKRSR